MKGRIGIIVLAILSPLIYNVVSFLTILVLWMTFGESALGSEKAIQTQNTLIVYHLPVLISISLLAYLIIRSKRRNKHALVTGGIAGAVCILIYVLMENYE